MCRCPDREDLFHILPGNLEGFLQPLTLLARQDSSELRVCEDCSQLWIVETGDNGPFAVKAHHPDELLAFDEDVYRRKLNTASPGG